MQKINDEIYRLEKQLIYDRINLESLKEDIKLIEDNILKGIEEDIDLATNKKTFSNENSRKRELRKRLLDHSEYKNKYNSIKLISESIDLKTVDIGKLKREFTIMQLERPQDLELIKVLRQIENNLRR